MKRTAIFLGITIMMCICVNAGNAFAQDEEQTLTYFYIQDPTPTEMIYYFYEDPEAPKVPQSIVFYYEENKEKVKAEINLNAQGKGSVACFGQGARPGFCETMAGCKKVTFNAKNSLTCKTIPQPMQFFMGWFVDGRFHGMQPDLELKVKPGEHNVKAMFSQH